MREGRFKENYQKVQSTIAEVAHSCGRNPSDVKLVAVTKNHSIDQIKEAYQAGCRSFGESRWQEAEEKIKQLPIDCEWHFIGSLQKNKVIKVLPHFSLIHSVSDLSLATKISELSQENTSILLQVNVTGETTKHGLSSEEWSKSLEVLNGLPNLTLRGLMTMAPFTQDEKVIRTSFRKLYELLQKWRGEMRDPESFTELSMGMSNDYPIAIEEGATLIRVGSALFEG